MPDTSAEQAIYNRLTDAPTFHPVTANLFAEDWALEPGDIVAVRSGENTLNVPIYGYNLEWNGNSMLQIQSTGNQNRKPLSALKRRQFSGGRKSYQNKKDMEQLGITYTAHFEQTDRRVSSTISATGVKLDENGNPIMVLNPETGEYEYAFDATGPGATLSSRVIQTASELRSEVSTRTEQGQTFSSQISQLANKISLVVTGEGQNAQVSRAALILAINGTGGSNAIIEADNIDLRGYVTADNFATTMAAAYSLGTHSLTIDTQFDTGENCQSTFDGPTYFNGTVDFTGAEYVSLPDEVYLSSISDDNGHTASISGFIVNAELRDSDTTLRLTKFNGQYVDFRKVTSLSGAWSDDGTLSATYTVSGYPNNIVTPVTLNPLLTFIRDSSASTPGGSPNFNIGIATAESQQGVPVETIHKSRGGYLIAGTNVVGLYDNPSGTGTPIASIQTSGGTPASIVKTGSDMVNHDVIVKAIDSGGTEVLSNKAIAADDIYEDGWTKCRGQLVMPTQNTSSNTMSLTVPALQPDARPDPAIQYIVSADNSNVYIKAGSVTYAQAPNPAYNNGQRAVTVTASGWDWDSTNSRYYNRVSGSSPNTSSVDVLVPALSVEVGTAGFSTSTYKANIYAYGPTVSGTRHSIQTIQADASVLRPDWVSIGAAAGASGHIDANGNTVTERTNDSNHSYYIETRGTGSAGTNANVYMVLHANVRNANSTLLYSTSANDKNIVMNAPVTGVYKEGYVDGYGNGRTAILNALRVRAGGWTWDSEEEEFYNTVTAYNGSTATSASTTVSLPSITSTASITYSSSRHEYAYASSATSGGHAIASSAVQWTGTQAYEDGWNGVDGSKIDLNGSSAATSTTKPSTAITKANGSFSGYIWLQLSDGTWKRLRSFSFSMPANSSASWRRSQYGTSGQYIYSCTVAGATYTHIF